MEVLFIRHGQSEHNIRITENLNSSLTEFGKEQSINLSLWLKGNFDFSDFQGICSPFLRTLQTANRIQHHSGLKFSIDPRCREYLMRSTVEVEDAEEDFPAILNHISPTSFGPESTESYINRFKSLLKNKLCVVSHEFPILTMHNILMGMSDEDIASSMILASERYNANLGLYTPIENCGMVWIKDGKCQWFSKTVNNECD